MIVETATVWALSALGIIMVSVWVYFAIFFMMIGAIVGIISVVFRSIFDIISFR